MARLSTTLTFLFVLVVPMVPVVALEGDVTSTSPPPSSTTVSSTGNLTTTNMSLTAAPTVSSTTALQDCGPLPNPQNGNVSFQQTTYDENATYTCYNGYKIEGKQTRTCENGGKWSGQTPNCTLVDCGTLSNPQNGNVSFELTTYDENATYTCYNGYKIEGKQTRTCENGGNWSGQTPNCTLVDCGTLSNPQNGNVSFELTTFDENATYTCNNGYRIEGKQHRTCENGGKWSGQTPNCTLVDCGTLSNPQNGNVSFELTTFSENATYTCNNGYKIAGKQNRSCENGGNWSGQTPNCTLVDCHDPPKPQNGDVRFNETSFGKDANYTCHNGYQINGNQTRTCEKNGNWSGQIPNCTLIKKEYGQTCYFTEQCYTTNAICNGNNCTCKYEDFHFQNDSCISRPKLPNGTFSIPENDVQQNSFLILFQKLENARVYALINPPNENGVMNFIASYTNQVTLVITSLTPGTHYSVELRYNSSVNYGVSDPYNLSTYTRPEKVIEKEVQKQIFEHSISIKVQPREDTNCTFYKVWIGNNYTTFQAIERNNTESKNATFQNLTGGTLYNFSIEAIAGNFSSEKFTFFNYTRPPMVENATVTKKTNTSLTLTMDYNGAAQESIWYRIYVLELQSDNIGEMQRVENKCCSKELDDDNTVFCTNKNTFLIKSLKPGELYDINIMSCIDGLESENAFQLNATTRPNNLVDVTIIGHGETFLEVQWSINSSIAVDKIELTINATGYMPVVLYTNGSSIGTFRFENLTAGTLYEISIRTIVGDTYSENTITMISNTRPLLTSMSVLNQLETKLELSVNTSIYFDSILVTITGIGIEEREQYLTVENGVAVVDNLKPGTNYNLTIKTVMNNITSSNAKPLFSFTRPGPPKSLKVASDDLYEDSFLLQWEGPDQGNVDEYCFTLSKDKHINQTGHCIGSSETNVTFKDLISGTPYTVNITSKWNNLTSNSYKVITQYTRPSLPRLEDINITEIETELIIIDINRRKWEKYTFILSSSLENGTHVVSSTSSEIPVKIDNLVTGTLYWIYISSEHKNISSRSNISISTYTRPGVVQGIKTYNSTTSSLQIEWDVTLVGYYDFFIINASCQSPNDESNMSVAFLPNTTQKFTVLSGLDPGTFCNITVVSVIRNVWKDIQLLGEEFFKAIKRSSDESAPEEIIIKQSNPDKREITFNWTQPLKPNGIIRKYKTLVIDNRANCTKAVSRYSCNADKCDDPFDYTCPGTEFQGPASCDSKGKTKSTSNLTFTGSSLTQSTPDLHPYRNYTIVVQAFTKCWGKVLSKIIQTQIAKPSSHQIDILSSSITKSSISLSWTPLDPFEEGNGPILHYTIRKTFSESNCTNFQTSNVITENPTSTDANKTLSTLRPYWNYSLAISASTEAGEGPYSDLGTYTTNQSEPGIISALPYLTGKTATSASFSWLPPCRTNGVITKYSVKVLNNKTEQSPNVLLDFNGTRVIVSKLSPYSNYTIAVRAFTKIGNGNYSDQKYFNTEIDVPRKPLDVIATPLNSSSAFDVTWTTPELYTGPTKYTVYAIDSVTKINVNCETGWNFNATNCNVTGLQAFWNYTIYVLAETGKGKTESDHITGLTAESSPGNVTHLLVTAIEDVTKPRTLTVSWNMPVKSDLNGILTAYFIIYHNTDEGTVYEDGTDGHTYTSSMTGILPGKYVVEVFAATRVGNGSQVFKNIFVKPGAPLKPKEETENSLLIQPSQVKPKDTERQIVVKLPLKDFLCNKTNGRLTTWGVIVAQDGEATDAPFTGSVKNFTERHYKTWFQVKDKDSISPYIATSRTWNNHCQSVYNVAGTRRKRETTENANEPEYIDFIVGENGTCSNVQGGKYCNGDLQPGRKYRVKTFACTLEGCTETMYSKPLSTDPDLTIPIAAGISSALLVIAIVFVVVFILRRKHLACFAKDDESLHTHIPGEGIHLDKIEHTKKNHFSPPGQGPIKLNDFPDAVEKFHKDSDLIFADAYKMLKEKSPNHPMTAAEQQCCRPKNRYTNILPFDHSRVKLRPSDDMEGSDYINANYIPGYTSRREYIATQGPMLATIDDFWRMVWEQNVDTIVMLTKLMEKGRHKCDKYWPDLGEPVFYGDLVVSLQSESNLSDYTIKIFEIKMKEERKMVRHFSYLKWPDMGCPETPELLLEFVKAVKQYGNREKKTLTGPMIVHCSAGVGRTGTFIAVDYLLQHIRDHDEVDIYNLVLEMRNHRLNMVQTEDQYIYIHECLKAFITTDEEEEDEEEAVYVNTGFGAEEESIYVNT